MTTQGFHVRRKVATYTYIVFGFLLGFEYTAINISQLFYLKLTVQVEEPEVFYSLITTGMAIAAAGSGVLAGYYTDKTRDLKKALFFFATLSLTGNLLYTIHHSVWFLLIGRFLCGLSDAAHPAISGKILDNIFQPVNNQTTIIQAGSVSNQPAFVVEESYCSKFHVPP